MGLRAMLNRTVPTWSKIVPGASVFAFTANTSWSGRLNGTTLFQLRPITSTQFVPLFWTMMPVSGAATDCSHAGSASSCRQFVDGPGTPPGTLTGPDAQLAGAGPAPAPLNPLRTQFSSTVVLRLPEWNAATYTF